MKKTIILFLLTVLFLSAKAQQAINYPTVNQKTYELFQQEKWHELIDLGKLSLENGIDFYYLQVRMGVAYYWTENYAASVKYFENAYSQNRDNELVMEYLYFAYVFSAQTEEARILADTFTEKFKKQLKIDKMPAVHSVYGEYMHEIFEQYAVPDAENLEQAEVKARSYWNLTAELFIRKRTTAFFSFSRIDADKLLREASSSDAISEKLKQNQYYFSLKYRLRHKMDFAVGFHLLQTAISEDQNGRQAGNVTYAPSFSTYAFSLSLSKRFPVFSTALSLSISNLNEAFQLQPTVNLNVMPFGNMRLVFNSKLSYPLQANAGSLRSNPVFKQTVGISFLKRVWFETGIAYGDMLNFTEYNAYVVNNDVDLTKWRFDALLNVSFFESRLNIFARYRRSEKENTYILDEQENQIKYINQSITGGIKWYF